MPRPARSRQASFADASTTAGGPGADPGAGYSPPERDALQLWAVFARATAAFSELTAADIKRHGLSPSEFAILELLYHNGAQLLGDVQKRVLVSSGGTTFLVDKLAARGLLERQGCPNDRRSRYAALTPAGRALIDDILPGHVRVVREAADALTHAEQQHLTQLLRRLGHHAAELVRAAPPDESGSATALPMSAAGRRTATRRRSRAG